jgi:CBS-domain-containing membrane protein
MGNTTNVPTIADLVPATWIMSGDVIHAREDATVDHVMQLMVRRHIGCVPIVDGRNHPIGMVTKRDLVENWVISRDADAAPPALTVGQLMMPLALTLDEHATVAHTAAMMAVEDVHHVPIVAESGCLIGIVSSFDIVRWLAANDGYLPDPS